MQAERLTFATKAVAEAPFTENGWAGALSLLRDVLSVRAVRLTAIDISSGRWRHAISGAPADWDAAAPQRDFGTPERNPRAAHALTAPLHRIWSDDELAPLEVRRSWDIYRELWAPNGCEQGWSVVLFRNGDTVVMLTAADDRRAARRSDVPGLLSPFVPVAAQAAEIDRTLRQRESRIVGRSFGTLNTGAVTLDGFGRVLDVNGQAREYINRSFPLRLRGSYLQAADPNLDSHLQKLIAHAVRAQDPTGSEVALPGDGGKFMILPLGGVGEDPLGLGAAGVVAINPQRPRQEDAEEKAAAFGLSAAERAILPAFLNGAQIDDIAAQRGTTRETIRSQLKSIYSKVGVNSRAELIVAFLGGVAGDGK